MKKFFLITLFALISCVCVSQIKDWCEIGGVYDLRFDKNARHYEVLYYAKFTNNKRVEDITMVNGNILYYPSMIDAEDGYFYTVIVFNNCSPKQPSSMDMVNAHGKTFMYFASWLSISNQHLVNLVLGDKTHRYDKGKANADNKNNKVVLYRNESESATYVDAVITIGEDEYLFTYREETSTRKF